MSNVSEKNNPLKKLTLRRISKLRKMFSQYDIDVTGNPEYPTLIYDNNKLLFTYINNFNLHFLTDFPTTGYTPETLFTVRISDDTILDEYAFNKCLKYYWKRVHVIRHQNTDLFLTGYSVQELASAGKEKVLSPVFGLIKRKYYYDIDSARDIVNLFSDLPLEII